MTVVRNEPHDTPLYLDHAASTPMLPEVLDLFVRELGTTFGNPSATGHVHGSRARALVEEARERIAALVGADSSGVIFTSGTTESNHLALLGLLDEPRGAHAVTTTIEHPSVSAVFDVLEARGLACVRAPCGGDGRVAVNLLAAAQRPSTVLVAAIHGNNETGALLELEALRPSLTDGPLLHVDAAQTARCVPIDMQRFGVDTLALSSHKLGGPKGVGALVCSPRALARLTPQLVGGGQERGLRSGTINAPAVAAFGLACELAHAHRDQLRAELATLSARMHARLVERVPALHLVGPALGSERLPHILTLRVPSIPATLLQAELRADLSIATGAACATTKLAASDTLKAMGLSDDEALEVVRLSVGPGMAPSDIDRAAAAFADAVNRLREGVAP